MIERNTRRAVLRAAGMALGGAVCNAQQRRSISGDPEEPEWESRLEISVGPRGADISGDTGKAIQAAVDYISNAGGGTVRILPGTFVLRNAVFLRPGVRIVGSGADSVLLNGPFYRSALALDTDHYEQEITLSDARGFEVGDGVCFRTRSLRNNGEDVFSRTLVARSGSRFKLDRPLPGYPGWMDLWLQGAPVVTSHHSLISGDSTNGPTIEEVTLDGNKAVYEEINGNHAAAVHLTRCNRAVIRRVVAKDYNGDGIAWITSHDVLVEECSCIGNEGLGLHAGSGSQRLVARRNRLEQNGVGFYFC